MQLIHLPNCDVDIGFDFELCVCSPKVECGPSPNACCTEYEQQAVNNEHDHCTVRVQTLLPFFSIDYAVCMLTAHAKPNQTPITKIAKMNYSIRFCAIDLIVPPSQFYSIQFSCFPSTISGLAFCILFFHFSHRNGELFSTVRYERFNRLKFFDYFLRHLLHSYQFGLNWERSVFLVVQNV